MNGKAKRVRVSWLAVALLPLLAGIVGAANPIPPQTNQPNQQDEPIATTPEQTKEFQPKLEKAKDLIGVKVLNEKEERLGTVEEIVLTPNRDAISYVVLSHGGVLGVGDKFFAVPWSQFSFKPVEPGETEKENVLVLSHVSKAALEAATGFDKNHWPATASANWLGIERGAVRGPDMRRDFDYERHPDETPSGDIAARAPAEEGAYTAPGTPGYREPVAAEPRADREESARAVAPGRGTGVHADRRNIEHRRLSKLFGMTIRNLQDEDLGKLDNAVIDVHQGQVAYGILSMRSGFLGLNKDLVAVPWSSLDITSQPGLARLDADKQTLAAIAFDEDNFPNLEDMQYSRQLYERFHATPYWETLGFVPGDTEHRDSSAWKEGSGYGTMSHPSGVKTIHGAVESVGTFRLEGPAMEGAALEGLSLRVKTDEGKTVTVHVGPRAYLDRQNITFQSGDQVTVIGSPAKVAGGDVMVASQIKTADKTLNLRTKEGKPLWNLDEFRDSEETRDSGQMRESYDL